MRQAPSTRLSASSPPTSNEQREAIFVLAGEEWPLRKIAAAVFGSAGAKDRVRRVLGTRRPSDPAPPATSAREELARLKVEIIKQNMAAVERANAITREPRGE
jgi:hypothetical protein